LAGLVVEADKRSAPAASEHVYRVARGRGRGRGRGREPVWYAKYRLPVGRQVQRKIGAASTERGRPGESPFDLERRGVYLAQALFATVVVMLIISRLV